MQVNKNAIISFIIFIIVVLKDILVSFLEIIPERSPANRLISWLFILPLIIIGAVLSVKIIRESYLKKKNEGKQLLNINLILSLPALFCFLYVFVRIVYAFTLR